MDEQVALKALAHVGVAEDGSWREHALEEHLREVARIAAHYAGPIEAQEWAHLAGLWHDLGKYSKQFQAYIRSAVGDERAQAHIEGAAGRVNHSAAGGLYALQRMGASGKILAQLIFAHHAGLYDAKDFADRLVRDEAWLGEALAAPIPVDILDHAAPP